MSHDLGWSLEKPETDWTKSEYFSNEILGIATLESISFGRGINREEMPALTLAVLYFWNQVKMIRQITASNNCKLSFEGKKKNPKVNEKITSWQADSSKASFLNDEDREEAAAAAVAAARTAWASLCLLSFLPRFFASLTSQRYWLTSTSSQLFPLAASISWGRCLATLDIKLSASTFHQIKKCHVDVHINMKLPFS